MTTACHECGGEAALVREPYTVQSGDRRVSVEAAEFMRCGQCGEVFFAAGQMAALQRAAAEIVRTEEGFLAPADIEAVRARYGLSQTAFERLINAGPKTVTRWERGTVAPNGTADTLLRILRDHPAVVAVLAAERGVELPAASRKRAS